MTISIWRYSHLALAVSSFLFIALAAVTGIILAFEPVSQKLQPFRAESFGKTSVAEAIPAIRRNFTDITEITVDANGFVTVKGINSDDKTVTAYVDPGDGKQLGIRTKQGEFFEWITSLHRSLFLHETGRFFVGLTAFLLLLIATSGTVLIVQRQRGVKRFFRKIVRDSFAQYYHVVLGRLMLIPIVIISASGTILSLGRFGIIPEKRISHRVDFDALKSTPRKDIADFAVFKKIPLAEVQSIEFPFSEDVEEYFTLKLKDREIVVNQVTGELLSEQKYPRAQIVTSLAMTLHTGRSSSLWAVVLAIAAGNILFFIWSGFKMTLKRRSGRVSNKYKPEKSRFIILVGSENGTTRRFAKAIHEGLIHAGEISFLSELNNYQLYPKAEHLVVITATYGLGNPPTNATKFAGLLNKFPQQQKVNFSVVGFGSHAYPDFCKFGFEVNNLLAQQNWAKPLLEIHTVNDRSPVEFALWSEIWAQHAGIPTLIYKDKLGQQPVKLQQMVVAHKLTMMPAEPAFMIKIQPEKKSKFRSGDLLALYPANDHRERLYSIGRVDDQIQLSVKLHMNGLGSGFLHELEPGATLHARIISNHHFYFPQKAPVVIMVSNGTGIAPFIGMIEENDRRIDCRLYCGFRTAASFELYRAQLSKNIESKKLSALHVGYSRQVEQQYVRDLLLRDADAIAGLLENQAVIMLCGSLSMQKSVIELLEVICLEKNKRAVSYYQSRGQILMDCY